jgi:hypothetical protein
MTGLAWRRLVPPEHGAWGFLAAAVLIALGVAPTWAGVLITLGAVLGVFARHWGQLALQGHDLWLHAFLLGGSALLAWGVAGRAAPAVVPWLAGALVVTLLQVVSDAGSRRHGTAGVLTGGMALALVGGAVAAAGGSAHAMPELVAAVVVGYLITVTPLVRARRQPRGTWRWHALLGHAVACVGMLVAACMGLAPWLVAACFTGLALRCLWLLLGAPRPVSPKVIGLAEIPPLMVLFAATVIGVRCGW